MQAVARNRNLQANPPFPIVEYSTLSTYDIVGNLLTVTDPLGRAAFNYTYDLMKRALNTVTIDAGTCTTVPDATGNIVEQRDSKGALLLHSYDVVNRPIRMWARDASGQTVTLREKIVYGDDQAGSGLAKPQAVAVSLLGKPYKHYDQAGLLTFLSYDFKGNLLDKTRNVITEAALLASFNPPPANWVISPFRVDWSSSDLSFLNTTTSYETTTAYDALNRIKTTQYPQAVDGSRNLLVPQYNHAGALESVQMDGFTYVERIAYNAKGQRILISYGNGFMTRYAYDPHTFRLLRMRTENYTLIPGTVTYHPSAPGNPLQDFGYEYDLVGNILQIHDRTPGSGIQNTALGADGLDRLFSYDPIYRLLSATGRECDVPPPPPPWDDTPRCMDITKARAYTETYQYDNVANMATWKHSYVDSSGNPGGTIRQFTLASGNNQLLQLAIGSTNYQYSYDASGNLAQENTDRHFEWDESDRIRVFRVQPSSNPPAPPSIYAQYLYDSGGQRVMKLVRDQSGGYETTIYINGTFEHQRSVTASSTVENNSLHIKDNQKRVTIVRVGPALPGDPAPAVKYHFSDHSGSSNVVVDDTGAWTNSEEYLPYGETSFGTFARKRYRFTGKERDSESGLYYNGARYYVPHLTRWSSCDPAGVGGGNNPYEYCRSAPTVHTDPDGKFVPLLLAGLAIVLLIHHDEPGGSEIRPFLGPVGAGLYGLEAGYSYARHQNTEEALQTIASQGNTGCNEAQLLKLEKESVGLKDRAKEALLSGTVMAIVPERTTRSKAASTTFSEATAPQVRPSTVIPKPVAAKGVTVNIGGEFEAQPGEIVINPGPPRANAQLPTVAKDTGAIVVQAEAETLPLKSGSVSRIYARNLEPGSVDWDRAAPEIARVLEPGGTVDIGSFGPEGPAIASKLQAAGLEATVDPLSNNHFVTGTKPK